MSVHRVLRAILRPWQAWPVAAWWVAFFIIPLAWIVLASFGSRPEVGQGGVVALTDPSLANYATAASDIFFNVFVGTIRTAGLGALLCLLVGFPVAYAIAVHVPSAWRGFTLFLLILPFWTSFLLRTFAWRIILAPEGSLSQAMQAVGVITGPLLILDTTGAVQIGIVYNYLPIMILPIYVALERIDRTLVAASMDLGAPPLATLANITLPLAMPGILGGLLMTFILAAGDYVVPTILGGTKGLMAGNLIATQILSAQNIPVGSAMASLLVLFICLVIALVGASLLVTSRLIRFGRRLAL